MQIINTEAYTKEESDFIESLPKEIILGIIEHDDRRLYLIFDDVWDSGGHPAVYTSLQEANFDILHEAMHDMEDAAEDDDN